MPTYYTVPPSARDLCRRFLHADPAVDRHPYFSQFRQDWIVYQNFFKRYIFPERYMSEEERASDAYQKSPLRTLVHGTGFYLDIGANDGMQISNSVFFDLCLGWRGICAEPNKQYHPTYEDLVDETEVDVDGRERARYKRRKRSCYLYKGCVHNHRGKMLLNLAANGEYGDIRGQPAADFVEGHHRRAVECITLDDLLARVLNDTTMPFAQMMREQDGKLPIHWASLDAEGSELVVLQGFNSKDARFPSYFWVVETNKVNPGSFFARLGYRRPTDLQEGPPQMRSLFVDDLFVHNDISDPIRVRIPRDEQPARMMPEYDYTDDGSIKFKKMRS
jgi:hypothetical protein